jgi:hypothetical protein
MNKLQGGQLAGGNPIRSRVEDDFYATPSEATEALLRVEHIVYPALEPACGEGHISKVIIGEHKSVISTDLINRGYGNKFVDFLKYDFDDYEVKTVITNPPFNYFRNLLKKH